MVCFEYKRRIHFDVYSLEHGLFQQTKPNEDDNSDPTCCTITAVLPRYSFTVSTALCTVPIRGTNVTCTTIPIT